MIYACWANAQLYPSHLDHIQTMRFEVRFTFAFGPTNVLNLGGSTRPLRRILPVLREEANDRLPLDSEVDAEKHEEGVALQAVLSAAPEPHLGRVSAVRLQSLTQGGGGSGQFA